MAEIKKSSLVKNFLELISQWDYNVPVTTQWALAIYPDADNLFNIIKDYTQIDVNGFYIPESIQKKLLGEKTQPNIDGLGLYYAQSVKIPKESFSINSTGVEGMAGYLKGTVGADRLDVASRHLNIDFLETNIDFVDGLIRPWIIAASYKGLINLGEQESIKASIMITEFTNSKNQNDTKPVRKFHKFEGCVPYEINDKTLNYESNVIINNVSWVYNEYTYKIDRS